MTKSDLGVIDIGKITPYTTLVRFANKNVRPATDLEAKLWAMLKEHKLV